MGTRRGGKKRSANGPAPPPSGEKKSPSYGKLLAQLQRDPGYQPEEVDDDEDVDARVPNTAVEDAAEVLRDAVQRARDAARGSGGATEGSGARKKVPPCGLCERAA